MNNLKVTRLKTLKDLKWKLEDGWDYVDINKLKAEAIKWIKKFRDANYIGDAEFSSEDGELFRWKDKFEDFFNITEEDLE